MAKIDDLKKDLSDNAITLNDVFRIASKHYNCDAPLGKIPKAVLIINIQKIISASGVKPKP